MELKDTIHNFVEDAILSLKISNSKGLHEFLVAFRPKTEESDSDSVRD